MSQETELYVPAVPVNVAEKSASSVAHALAAPQVPGFESLEFLGRGGMGVVYKARQTSLKRLVALKIIRGSSSANTEDLARFRTEAQVIARLQHPNIIQVHEIGEYDGLPYLALEFVAGGSLKDYLAGEPVPSRDAALLAETIARAVFAAHQQGVVHRDLKPANVLLAWSDSAEPAQSGIRPPVQHIIPKIADFGLAKCLDEDSTQTKTGQVLGTPSYMAPEQALGRTDQISTAVDVYALGAILYELLTGRPPFRGASIQETLEQVRTHEPVSPRLLVQHISRDLETITLKALAKEPGRRYASAGELADDLQRWLKGEPIKAQAIGVAGRLLRWCRRKPAVAALIGLTAALTLLVLGTVVIGAWNTVTALEEADANMRQAREVVDEMFTRVGEDGLLNEPGMQPLRKQLLQRALQHYQALLEQRQDKYIFVWRTPDPTTADALALARYRAAKITAELGSRETAHAELLLARDLQRQLLDERPDDKKRILALHMTLNTLGIVCTTLHRIDEAWDATQQAIVLVAQLVELEPENVDLRLRLANGYMNLGLITKNRGKLKDARKHMVQAQEIREAVLLALGKSPSSPEAQAHQIRVQVDLAKGLYNLANWTFGPQATFADSALEMENQLRSAIGLLQKALAKVPRSLENRYTMALCYRALADLRVALQDAKVALSMYDAARQQLESLFNANPDVPKYRQELASVYTNLGQVHAQQGNNRTALDCFEQAERHCQHLVEAYPTNSQYGGLMATTRRVIANLKKRTADKKSTPRQ